jgi:hypothetical protein
MLFSHSIGIRLRKAHSQRLFQIWKHISYNSLIYNLCIAPIIIRHLIKNICDVLNLTNMSDIELDFFIRWRIIIEAF